MIQIAERKEQQENLLKLCAKSAFGCKSASIAMAYGFDKKFSCFWTEDQSTAVYCLVDDVMILSGTPKNAQETKSFLHMVGAKELICALRNEELLALEPEQRGDIMQKVIVPNETAAAENEVNIRDIYFLLEECGMATDFEAFYLDLSHRLRHGAALAVTQYSGHELTGCAVVSSITGTAAILSAVAVREEYRRQGIGKKLVQAAEKGLGGKTVYVFKEKDKNEEFYKELGYHKADTWVSASLTQ